MSTEMIVDSTAPAKATSALRSLWPWYGAELLNSYTVTLLCAAIYWYADVVLHASDSQRLWLAATYGYAYILIAFFAGKLVERWGPRRTAITSIGGCVVAAILGLVCTHWFGLKGLAIALLAYNLTSTPFWPAAETAVTHASGNWSLATRTSLYNIVWSVTCFLAYLMVGWIFQLGQFSGFLIAAGLSMIGVTMLVGFTARASRSDNQHDTPPAAPAEPEDPAIAKRATRLLHMAWVGNALAYVAIQTLVPMIPTLAHRAQIPTVAMSAAAASAWTLTRTIFFVIALRWISWHYSVRYLMAFQALLVLSFFTAMQLDHLGLPTKAVIPVFMLSQIAFGMASGFVYTSSLYYAMHVSQGAGGHAGLHEALLGIGIALGPTIGAIAGAGHGHDSLPRVAYAVTALLTLGSIIMLLMGINAPNVGSKTCPSVID